MQQDKPSIQPDHHHNRRLLFFFIEKIIDADVKFLGFELGFG
jgi:hypothetical protein